MSRVNPRLLVDRLNIPIPIPILYSRPHVELGFINKYKKKKKTINLLVELPPKYNYRLIFRNLFQDLTMCYMYVGKIECIFLFFHPSICRFSFSEAV